MSIITVSFWNCDGLAGREKINNNNNKSNHMEVWYTPKKKLCFSQIKEGGESWCLHLESAHKGLECRLAFKKTFDFRCA